MNCWPLYICILDIQKNIMVCPLDKWGFGTKDILLTRVNPVQLPLPVNPVSLFPVTIKIKTLRFREFVVTVNACPIHIRHCWFEWCIYDTIWVNGLKLIKNVFRNTNLFAKAEKKQNTATISISPHTDHARIRSQLVFKLFVVTY